MYNSLTLLESDENWFEILIILVKNWSRKDFIIILYPTYPSSRGPGLLFVLHYRPPTLDVFAPTLKITVSAADPRYFTCDANKIGY